MEALLGLDDTEEDADLLDILLLDGTDASGTNATDGLILDGTDANGADEDGGLVLENNTMEVFKTLVAFQY